MSIALYWSDKAGLSVTRKRNKGHVNTSVCLQPIQAQECGSVTRLGIFSLSVLLSFKCCCYCVCVLGCAVRSQTCEFSHGRNIKFCWNLVRTAFDISAEAWDVSMQTVPGPGHADCCNKWSSTRVINFLFCYVILLTFNKVFTPYERMMKHHYTVSFTLGNQPLG
jgi:hypothetical protein